MNDGFELFEVPVPWEFWAMLSEVRFSELMAGDGFTDEEVALVLRLNGRLH